MDLERSGNAPDLRQRGDWNQEVNPVILALREVLVRNGVALAAMPFR